MTQEQKMDILNRINEYADKVLKDIDPQKTKISIQLEKLKPEMEKIAKEYNTTVEEIFILYMDLTSEITQKEEADFQIKVE